VSSARRCEPWRALGLPCPYVLLEASKERKKTKERKAVKPEPEADELQAEHQLENAEKASDRKKVDVVFAFDKLDSKKGRAVTMQDWEALLLEIARQSARQTIEMPKTHVPIPQEIREEAIRQGARGRALSLWIATVAAVLAAGAAGGFRAALAVPGVLRAAASLPGSVRPGGTRFNAAAALEFALQSVGKSGGTEDGEFFPGILG